MNVTTPSGCRTHGFELRFVSLFNEGRALAFPCDASGQVDIDEMTDKARSNYFYARTAIGREFARPTVLAHTAH